MDLEGEGRYHILSQLPPPSHLQPSPQDKIPGTMAGVRHKYTEATA